MRIIVKLGGELMSPGRSAELTDIITSLRALLGAGHRVALVHGGGSQVSALQTALGQTPNMVAGRRVTDAAALETIKMVVGGQVNVDLVSALQAGGVNAVGLNGSSGQTITCVREPPATVAGAGHAPVDYGFVGRITRVNGHLFDVLAGAGYVPVLACIGSDGAGQVYNINADTVANAVARALSVDALVMLTATPGVLRDKDDPSTCIHRLTVAEGRAAIADGTVQGGMIPKLEASFATIEAGVGRVLILGQLGPGQLEAALEAPGGLGTALVP